MKKFSENYINKFLINLLEEKGPISKKKKKNILQYRFLEDGHIDSLAIFSFINKIENKFKIKFSVKDTNSDEFRHIKGLSKIIIKKTI